MTDHTHDIIIIGGGTAGLVTAAGAAALGARAALIERTALGGECLWTACVPSKALIAYASRIPHPDGWKGAVAWLQSARDRIAVRDSPERFRGLGVDVRFAPARLVAPGRVEIPGAQLTAKRIVLAMGSAPAIPDIPGLSAAGYLTHATALELSELPASIIVLGGGPTGLEFAQTFQRLGAKVTVVEIGSEVLPGEDPEAGAAVRRQLESAGITFALGFEATRVRGDAAGKTLLSRNGVSITARELFVATGRRANTEHMGLEQAGIALQNGAVKVDARLATSAPGVWAAGDVTGGLEFTNVADYMAQVVVQNALTPIKTRADYRVVPRVTFTDPEVASVGATEAVARARSGDAVQVHRADFADNDRAIIDGTTAGFCKIVARPDGTVLGATIVGAGASEVISHIALAMRHGIRLPQLARALLPYPTLSEIVKTAAAGWYRRRYGDTIRGRVGRHLLRWWR